MNSVSRKRKLHSFRKCEICKIKQKPGSGVFLARFPLDTYYCRLWIKAVGDTDFLHLPAEQLHKNKYICGNHFTDKDFGKNKKMLRKKAVPTLALSKPPLEDELLKNFPPNIKIYPNQRFFEPFKMISDFESQHLSASMQSEGHQSNDETENKATENKEAEKDKNKTPPLASPGPSTAKRKCSGLQVDDNYTHLDEIDIGSTVDKDEHYDTIDICAEENLINAFDDDIQFVNESRVAQEPQMHTDFRCNICQGDIIGPRYTCVQCADWDMCTSCEARGEHPEHYVLRLPAPKPYGDHAPVITAIRDHIQELLKNEIHEVYCKEEAVDEQMYEELSSEAADPLTVINDRSVPEINLRESSRAEESTDRRQELLTQECVLKKCLMNPDPTENITTVNQIIGHSVQTDGEESEVKNENMKVLPVSEGTVTTTPKVINVIKPISESTVPSIPRVMNVITSKSASTVKTTPKTMDSTLIKTGIVKNFLKIPLRVSNIFPAAKVIDNISTLPKRKIYIVKKSVIAKPYAANKYVINSEKPS